MPNDDQSRRPGQPQLDDLGILTLGELLSICSTAEGRAKVARATGMSEDRLHRMLATAAPQTDRPETRHLARRLEDAGLFVVKNLPYFRD